MTTYFHEENSMHYKMGDNTTKALEAIANTYMASQPPHPFVFRAAYRHGITQLADGRFDFNMREKHPQSTFGQYAYAMGMLWSDSDRKVEAAINCYGPITIAVNGLVQFKSTVVEEVNVNVRKTMELNFQKGWNVLLLSFRSVASGFGCIFGSNRSSAYPFDVMAPFVERSGQAGWVYSDPVDSEGLPKERIFGEHLSEEETSMRWHPNVNWSGEQASQLQCMRMFGYHPDAFAYGWTLLRALAAGTHNYVIKGFTAGKVRLWIDGNEQYASEEAGEFQIEVPLSYGNHHLVVETACGANGWGFTVSVLNDREEYGFEQPHSVKGPDDHWLYVGPFAKRIEYAVTELQTLYRLFAKNGESEPGGECTYWRLDRPGMWVRPYLQNIRFARWNYPLGVTLYGLLKLGEKSGRNDMIRYVLDHMTECIKMYHYAKWDREQYGYPAINHKLVEFRMLDDCGSFGSAMLEAYRFSGDSDVIRIAEDIADYMAYHQERREDGAFYREIKGYFMENTLWADDLYMSTPFLCRYSQVTGKQDAIEDAVRQFILYRKYLFMPQTKLMSHVYDFKYETPTYIPWGRGNGWVVFSLSELLHMLPKEHEQWETLRSMFQELCEGALACQGDHGLWHQVLTDPTSYEETSCTSMFAYAFARGIRFGWLPDQQSYIRAAQKAWDGLTRRSIDAQGNIFGVCCGSRYSYTAEYYKYELKVILNDPHGIGIVMLAGIEVEHMNEWLGCQ
jgi:unsaturated rhamnogalacturonyl hydrolase